MEAEWLCQGCKGSEQGMRGLLLFTAEVSNNITLTSVSRCRIAAVYGPEAAISTASLPDVGLVAGRGNSLLTQRSMQAS